MSHWQPVRAWYRRVLKTSRMATSRGRPPGLAGGMRGLISFQWHRSDRFGRAYASEDRHVSEGVDSCSYGYYRLKLPFRIDSQLASELTNQGHPVCARTVGRLLKASGDSLQGNRKTKERADHPDRNAQFERINATVMRFQRRGQPVISVDTKKKELVGEFRNGGREWQPKGEPVEVRVHDFMDKELGKAIPYGVYDITENQGWVSVGIDHDTARFADRKS